MIASWRRHPNNRRQFAALCHETKFIINMEREQREKESKKGLRRQLTAWRGQKTLEEGTQAKLELREHKQQNSQLTNIMNTIIKSKSY